MRTKHHMSVNIRGMIRNNPCLNGMIEDDDGVPLSHEGSLAFLNECLEKGWVKLPMSADCEGFDHFGGGCPGHPIDEPNPESPQKEEPLQ